MDILNLLQYSFIQKAFIAGAFVSVVCSVLGVFLVLRKMSLIGDGLSHVSFGAIAFGLFLGVYPFYIAIPIVMLSSILILNISQKAKIYGDSAIGIVSAIGISTGLILTSISGGFNVDLFSYLFGNILAVSNLEVIMSVVLSIIVLLVVYLFYWDFFAETYDEEFAQVSGIKTKYLNTILALLTSVTVVLATKTVGVMLVSALLILPAVSALQIAKNFKSTLIIATIISLISVIIGIILSFVLNLPTGATIVIVNAFFLLFTIILKRIRIK